MSLVIAERGLVVVLCKNRLDLEQAIAPMLNAHEHAWVELDAHYGDGVHHLEICKLVHEHSLGPRKIVSTQNPIVVDCIPLMSGADVLEHFLLIREGSLVNMTEEQAQSVWGSYERGVMHTSELLRAEGLW